jgi:phosphohistidine phosphatase
MRLLFIRHAIADDKEVYEGNDLLRELTQKGKQKAIQVVKMLTQVYEKPTLILSSPALRAMQTAQIVSEAFQSKVISDEILLPGCEASQFKKLITPYYQKDETIIVVGHEPDFSYIISALISREDVAISVKKASCIEIEINEQFYGELKALIPPKMLLKFASEVDHDTV